MQLTELRVIRLPGLEYPFTINPQPGVNLITGPNGSGKSSITRAVFHLLWPQLQDLKPCDLKATFQANETTWQAESQGHRPVRWTKEGKEEAGPTLPDFSSASCYRLGFLDLNLADAGQSEQDLARQIRKLMDGGFDLKGTEDRLFSLGPQIGKAEARKLTEARQEVRRIDSIYQELARRAENLKSLERRYQDAKEAEARRDLLERVLEQHQIESELEALKKHLDDFEKGVATVLVEDPKNLAQLREDQVRALDAVNQKEALVKAIETDCDDLDFADAGEGTLKLKALDRHLNDLRSLNGELKNLHRRLAGARRLLDTTSSETEAETLRPVDQQTYKQLLDLHGQKLELAFQVESLQKQLAQLKETQKPWLYWALVVLGVVGLAAGYVMWQEGGLRIWPWLAVGLGSFCGAVGAFFLGRTRPHSGSGSAEELENQLKMSLNEETKIQGSLASLALEHGLDLDDSDLIHDLKFLGLQLETQWKEQQNEAQLEGEEKQILTEMENHQNQARAILDGLGIKAESIEQGRDALDLRITTLHDKKNDLKVAQGELETARTLDRANRKQITEIFERVQLNFHSDSDQDIALLASKKPDHDRTLAQVASLESQLTRLDKILKASGALLESMSEPEPILQKSEPELRHLVDQERSLAEGKEALHAELTGLRRELELARGEEKMEAAAALEDRCLGDLESKRSLARRSGLGIFLLGEVRQQSETRSRPRVLEKARELFARFTHQQYELVVSQDEKNQGVFLAKDTSSHEHRTLKQLSDGTRAQLLLAVRLGFIFESESHHQPPLFLDDALAASDPARFATIATNLAELARQESRQIFYLTPNASDTLLWNQAMEKADMPAAPIIDLTHIRALARAASFAQLAVPQVDPIPLPQDMTAEEYGMALGVPALDPWKEPGAAHLYYLLPDRLDVLYTILNSGFSNVGQMAAVSWDPSPLDPADHALVGHRLKLWPLVQAAWQAGRPRPLTMDDVLASGAVSDTMSSRVEAVLKKSAGNGFAFMHALKQGAAPGFMEQKKNQLQDHLKLAGFLDSREVLGEEKLVQEVFKVGIDLANPTTETQINDREIILRLARYLDQSQDPTQGPDESYPKD